MHVMFSITPSQCCVGIPLPILGWYPHPNVGLVSPSRSGIPLPIWGWYPPPNFGLVSPSQCWVGIPLPQWGTGVMLG